MKTSSTISIIAAFLSAGGAMAGYIFLRPKNLGDYLKWQGFTLASADDESLWKAIYSENEEYFKSIFPTDESEQKWQKIKKYCSTITTKTDYDNSGIESAKKLCLDNVKTVKGQLVRNKKEVNDFMTQDDEFKTAVATQGNDKFWELIGAEDDSLEKRFTAYRKWCEESLKSKPKEDLVKNVDNFCHKKPYSDFQSKLTQEGYVRFSDEEIEEQYTKLGVDKLQKNVGSNWLETIGGGPGKWETELGLKVDSWSVEKQKFIDKYKEYCKAGDTKKLFEEDNYPKKFSEYRSICSKEDPKEKKDEN